jgi:hypothetical protein
MLFLMLKVKLILGSSYFGPGLNVMYGDAKGNVAWWATGKLYKHNEGSRHESFWMVPLKR